MDRDKRWDRVEKAYDAMVEAKGETAGTPKEAVDKAYASDKLDDEFVRADGDRRLSRACRTATAC